MQYKWLLFDADNTLMDFDRASRVAMEETYKHFGMTLTDDNYKVYKTVNHQCWKEFENSEIDALTLRSKRFALLFDWLKINPTTPEKMGAEYLRQLSIHNTPYDGVNDLLHTLSKSYKLSIITNGLKEVQRPSYERLGWDKLFESIVVSDEIGVQKPRIEFFQHAWKSIEHTFEQSEALVIGDNIFSDIAGGIGFGLDTCWISRGKENRWEVKPTYTIEGVLELPGLLR